MANYVGESGGYKCAGKSSVWDATGKLIGQLDSETEGILIYDTQTKEILKKTKWTAPKQAITNGGLGGHRRADSHAIFFVVPT